MKEVLKLQKTLSDVDRNHFNRRAIAANNPYPAIFAAQAEQMGI
jgi:hypothetical protein